MENDIFSLREMTEQDHRDFLAAADEEAGVSCRADETFGAVFLDVCQQNAAVFSIIDHRDQSYIGYVIIKHTDTSTPELGIFVHSSYRSHGIGTAATKAAASLYAQSNTVDHYLIRVKSYNAASRRMIEKLGAQFSEDEGDASLDIVKRITQEIGGKHGQDLLDDFLKGYDIEGQKVLLYRYNI